MKNFDDDISAAAAVDVEDVEADVEKEKLKVIKNSNGNCHAYVGIENIKCSNNDEPEIILKINGEQNEPILKEDEEQESHIRNIRKWTMQRFDALPLWLRDNKYLLTGHRPPLPSVLDCFKSIFSIHSETGNIWTHLLGCVAFFVLAVWFLTHENDHVNFQEKIVFSFFFAGAILCLGCSFIFHTLCCHSEQISLFFRKLDYTGISMLLIGSVIPYIYYAFYCRQTAKIFYISAITLIGFGAMFVSLSKKFGEFKYRTFRAGVFVAMGLSGVFPAMHLMYTDGWTKHVNETSFIPLFLMAFLYIFGAAIYGLRIPEKYFPGKFDIWLQSHQLLHICVIVAAFTHFYGIQKMARLRLIEGKC